MPVTYIHRDTASDLSAGGLFNHAYALATAAGVPISPGSISAGTSSFGYVFTPAGLPGTNGTSTGSFTVEVNVTTGATSIQIAVQLYRVNSAGTVQATATLSAEQQATAGVKTFNFTNPALGTWTAGDRLRVGIRFRSTDSHGNTTLPTFTVNTTNAETVTPFTPSATTVTVTHTTDFIKKAIEQISHTTDAILRSTEQISHTTDAILRATSEVSHTTDAVLSSGAPTSPPNHLLRSTFEGTGTSFSHSFDTGAAGDKVLLVIVRHGTATTGITHNTPTYNGVSLTQVGTILDARADAVTNRRMTVWKLADPANGANTLAGGFSASVTQYSVTAILVDDADDVDLTTIASASAQTGTNASINITAGDPDSLIYVTVMHSTGSSDPYSPQGTATEVEDSSAQATTNHSFATAYDLATGASQSIGLTAGTTGDFAILALEVTPVPGGGGGAANPYEAEVIAKGAIYYYPLDAVISTQVIDRISSLNMAVVGAPSVTDGPTSILSDALRFDGVDDAADVTPPSRQGDGTILMWVRTQALGQTTHDEAPFNTADTNRINCGEFVQDDVGGISTWQFHGIDDFDVPVNLYGDAAVVDQWEFFAVSLTPTAVRFYQANAGVVVEKQADTTGNMSQWDWQTFRVAQGRAEVEFGQHDVAGLAIFHTGLSQTDIQDIYDAAFAPTVTHTTDAVLLATEALTHTTDAVVQNQGVDLTHTTDAILIATDVLTHTTDAVLLATETLTHTTDAILLSTEVVSHTTDAVLRSENTLAHTADFVLQAEQTQSHTTDAILSVRVETSHDTDAVLQDTTSVSHTTDALLSDDSFIVTDFTVTRTATDTFQLQWADTTGADAYQVRRDGVIIAQPTLSEYEDSGLAPGTVYSYEVRALRWT